MTIFIDASALVSFYNEEDNNYLNAKTIVNKFSPTDELLISNLVFAEIVTILSQKVGKQKAVEAGNYIKKNISLIRLTEDIEDLAWEIFKKQPSKNVSFVDCTTIALFQKGIFDKLFAFDSDFKKNGVTILE